VQKEREMWDDDDDDDDDDRTSKGYNLKFMQYS
jgi:hypothetical protein